MATDSLGFSYISNTCKQTLPSFRPQKRGNANDKGGENPDKRTYKQLHFELIKLALPFQTKYTKLKIKLV